MFHRIDLRLSSTFSELFIQNQVGPSQHRTNIPFAVTDPILSQEQHGTLGFDLNRPVFPYTACGHDLLGTAQTFRLQ
ncbi:hypothetical protein QR680_010688 [Steinernema hermaphroditum]|uniref:Uncharacterized protein n=1 Tax=Steinernema hermaphroditum TaxID=289476 RepID=A0AA39IPS6_9BILA|nr:hypothetical protein QR680_010688 [Steinernema hermaphroditum]